MITPKRIRIYNYYIIESIDLKLEPGLYFITGENRDEPMQDSNGAGKSLLCSSIVWALFEDVLRKGVKLDDVIGPSDSYTEVELHLDINGQDGMVRRVRNHPEHGNMVWFKLDGKDLTHQTSKRKTTKKIQDVMGINKDVLYYCAFSHDEGLPLVGLTSSQLNKVVAKIIDTERFDDWVKYVRNRGRGVEQACKELRKDIANADSNIDYLEDHIEGYKQQIEDFDDKKLKEIESIQEDIAETQSEIDDFSDLIDGEQELRDEYEELEQSVEKVEELNAILKKHKRDRDKRKETVTQYRLKIDKITSRMKAVKDNLENLTKNPSGKCNVCGNYLSDSKELDDKAAEFQEKFNHFEARRVELEVDKENVESKVVVLNHKVENTKNRIAKHRQSIERYHKIDKKLSSIDKAKNFINTYQNKINKLEKKIEEKRSETPDGIKQSLNKSQDRLEELEKRRDEHSQALQEKLLDKEAYQALEDSIVSAKAARFNSFVYKLQKKTNEYLDEMTEGDYHCRLQEDGEELSLSFTSSSKDGYYHYNVFSKGEKARISKAASTALNSIMNLGFIVDDEGLDGVDDSGIKCVLDFVTRANRGKVFLFVGHQKIMKDFFRSATNLHLIKEDGVARLVER